jgi:V-type H+-transporting ATPase subunit a
MIPSEAAHDTVAALGTIGMLQFRDLNPEKSAFQRTYATQVRLANDPRGARHTDHTLWGLGGA